MKNKKANQRDNLIMEFGILMQPLNDLASRFTPPEKREYNIANAKLSGGIDSWSKRVKEFTFFANDIDFVDERRTICKSVDDIKRWMKNLANKRLGLMGLEGLQHQLKHKLEESKTNFISALDAVPFDWEPEIFEANTPFTSYLRIKETMSIITKRINYFDRYLKEDFFFLFLKYINRDISVRLITTQGNTRYGIKNVSHISNLARQEFKDYQLIEIQPSIIHDRNLRIDDKIFSLGPGTDRAGMALTNFCPSDDSAKAHKELDDIISSGSIIHQS